jgi:ABC-2 type transport system permease protein
LYTIYALEQPLAPGEKLNMNFNVGYATHGFTDGNERPEFAYSGTFFDAGYFPYIGYSTDFELTTPPPPRRASRPGQTCPTAATPTTAVTNLFSPQSDWITYHTVVSTSDDQIALAPGYPNGTWHQNGRHYFEYNMGDVRIADFFAYVSGRYDVKRDVSGRRRQHQHRGLLTPPRIPTTSTT